MPLRLYFLFGILCVLGGTIHGCGREVENNVATTGNRPGDAPLGPSSEAPHDYSEDLRKLRTVQVTCPTGECHPAVGMVVAMEGSQAAFKLRRCTGFLIESNIVATAAHCLPSEVLSNAVPCSTRVQIAFPSIDSYVPERFVCTRVLESQAFIAERDYAGSDLVFFKIAKSSLRPALSTSSEGLNDRVEGTLQAVKLNSRNDTDGEIRSYPFVVAQKSLLLPQFNHPLFRAGSISGEGFSALDSASAGGPVLFRKDSTAPYTVNAILSRTVSLPASVKSDALWNKLIPSGFLYKKLALVTNLACSDSSQVKQSDPKSECEGDLSIEGTKKRWEASYWLDSNRIQEADQYMKNIVQNWIKQETAVRNPDLLHIRWERFATKGFFETPTSQTRFTAYPICFENPESWLQRFASGNTYKRKATFDFAPPKWTLRFEMNSAFQMKIQHTTQAGPKSEVEFSPLELNSSGESRVWINYRDLSNPFARAIFDASLKSCRE